MYRYDVAKVLNIDPQAEREVLDIILEELPSDDGWDLEVPVQRGYHKAGFKRYKIEHNLLSEYRQTDGQRDVQIASLDKAAKENFLDETGAGSSKEARIKLEHGAHLAMMGKVKVLRSAEKLVGSLSALLKKDRASLLAKGSEAGHYLFFSCFFPFFLFLFFRVSVFVFLFVLGAPNRTNFFIFVFLRFFCVRLLFLFCPSHSGAEKAKELEQKLATAATFHDSLLAVIAQSEETNKEDDEACPKLSAQATSVQREAESHTDALKALRKKVTLFLKTV